MRAVKDFLHTGPLRTTLSLFLAFAQIVLLLPFASLPRTAHAAAGDISAVRILDNGWMAEIDIDGFKDGGAYDFGLSSNNNDPAGAKIVFTVTSQGYNASGNLGTITRTVYGTYWVRKAYPNEAQKDEFEDATKVTLKVALSDFIYDDDEAGAGKSGTDVTVDIAGGLYTDNGTGGSAAASNAVNDLVVTNNSVLDYPKVIGRWAWPGYERVTADFLVEAVAFHRSARNAKPIAAIAFEAADQNGNASHATTTEMTKTTRNGDANVVQVYAATMDVDVLTQGQVIDVNFRAYPWVGDENSVLDSRTAADGIAQPDERLGPLHQLNDKAGTYGIGYALVSNAGSDTTGTVYGSQAAAEAGNAFRTIENASEAIRTYHNANYARDNAGGGVVLLAEGTFQFPGDTPASLGVSMDTWLIVKPASVAAKANTIINGGTNVSFQATRLKIEGITLATTTGTNTLRGRTATDVLWLHDNTIDMTQTAPIYSYKSVYATQNNITAWSRQFANFSTTKSPYAIIRGNTAASYITSSGNLYAILGNKNVDAAFAEYDHAAGHKLSDNSIYAFNSAYDISTVFDNMANTSIISHGVAVVQNVLEKTESVQPLFQIAADSSTSTANHIIVWENTFAGQRTNLAYNDTGTEKKDRLNWSLRSNIYDDWNNKDDTFGTQNANRTGGWPVAYNVGSVGNSYRTTTFRGEYDGLHYLHGSSAGYTDDNSYSTGDASGNGTYTLTGTSASIDLATTTSALEQLLPYDFLGNPIYGSSDAGAYEYQPTLTMGIDGVSTSTTVRMYGDEKFRNKSTPSAAGEADLSVTIPGSDTTQWLDIAISTWENSGTRRKVWTETSSTTALTNTIRTVGDLSPSTNYEVSLDGVLGQNITGASCTGGVCTSNGSGEITFTYTGLYSSRAFDVEEQPDSSPVAEVASSGGGGGPPPDPKTPEGGFKFNIVPASGNTFNLSFGFGSDIRQIIISENENFEPATRIQATASTTWSIPPGKTLYVKFCNRFGECTEALSQTAPKAIHNFTRNLENGMTGEDVRELQRFLNSARFTVALTGAGSPGSETDFFGPATQSALARYQAANNISPAVGFFGPITRATLLLGGNQATPPPAVPAPVSPSSSTLTRNLSVRNIGEDVRALQVFLNANGFTVSTTGAGSSGNETTYFGSATEQAVIKFQEAFASSILAPLGLLRGTGFVGPSTLKEMNRILSTRP